MPLLRPWPDNLLAVLEVGSEGAALVELLAGVVVDDKEECG